MPSQIGDFINTFLNMAQLQQHQEQLQQAHTDATVNGLNVFANLARQTANPAQQTALVERFSQLGVATKDQLIGMLQNLTPTNEALKAGEVQRGIGVQEAAGTGNQLATRAAESGLTGQDVGQNAVADFLHQTIGMAQPNPALGQAFATRLAAGQDVGGFAASQAEAGLSPSELQQAGGIKAGTRLSAGENASMQGVFAGVRERANEATMQNALGQAELNFKAASKGAVDLSSLGGLLQTKAGLLANLQKAKDLPPAIAKSYIGALNSINATLSAIGQPNEGQIPLDPDSVVIPGFISSIITRYQQNLMKFNPAAAIQGTGPAAPGGARP